MLESESSLSWVYSSRMLCSQIPPPFWVGESRCVGRVLSGTIIADQYLSSRGFMNETIRWWFPVCLNCRARRRLASCSGLKPGP